MLTPRVGHAIASFKRDGKYIVYAFFWSLFFLCFLFFCFVCLFLFCFSMQKHKFKNRCNKQKTIKNKTKQKHKVIVALGTMGEGWEYENMGYNNFEAIEMDVPYTEFNVTAITPYGLMQLFYFMCVCGCVSVCVFCGLFYLFFVFCFSVFCWKNVLYKVNWVCKKTKKNK